jgi:hypothetical protein
MYRDPSSSMAQTIERLEAEIRDLRLLGGGRREQRLIVMTLLSLLVAVFSVIACVDAREHTTFVESQARAHFEDPGGRCPPAP